MLNLKEMIEFANSTLSKFGVLAAPLDIRTVRYYTAIKLIDKPEILGRENQYDVRRVKQALAIKILQEAGHSLQQIKARTGLDEVLLHRGINPAGIELSITEFVANKPEPIQAKAQKEEEVFTETEEVQEVETSMSINQEQVSIEITNGDEYNKIRESLRLGSSFVFADKVSAEAAVLLHTLLHGYKGGVGSVTRAVLPVTSILPLPGATAKAGDATKAVALILTDKDIYREGTDVARAFIFCPTASGQSVKALVFLDGAQLDEVKVDLDENGCGLIRVPTLVSGTYEINVSGQGWAAYASFETARYELSPFTVTLDQVKKDGSGIAVSLKAESLSCPFSGETRLELMEGEAVVETLAAKFEDGKATATFAAKDATSSLAIRVINLAKPSLIANVPLPGSAKSEREETEVSRLGNIVSVSLMGSASSVEAMGLYYTKSGKTNSPIALKSCVGKAAELKFNEDASEVVVFVRDLETGTAVIKEIGDVKKGQTKKVQLQGTLSIVHVGAFVGDEPWEGHAAMVKPAGKGVSVNVAKRATPGEAIEIDVKGPKGASVLLKIVDKRLRVQYEPMVKAASIIKEAVAAALKGKHTGRAKGVAPIYFPPQNYGFLRGYGGSQVSLSGLGGGGGGVYGSSGITGLTGASGSAGMSGFSGAEKKYMFGSQNDSQPMRRKAKYLANKRGGSEARFSCSVKPQGLAPSATNFVGRSSDSFELTSGPIQLNEDNLIHTAYIANVACTYEKLLDKQVLSTETLCEGTGLDYDGEVAAIRAEGGLVASDAQPSPAAVRVREVEADVIYCDLIKANRTVTIVLPDVIGNYDVRAFCVSKGRWTEAEESIRVEKDCYIEPMIPVMADPKDQVPAEAWVVRCPEDAVFSVKVDGTHFPFKTQRVGQNVRITWTAVPGAHEVTVMSSTLSDKVKRVVEAPGEEIVLTQEMMILKAGETFDVARDGALSVKVMPGMEQETRLAIKVLTDFGHACCEQSAAMITAAALSLFLGDDSSKEQASQLIVKGEARMKGMWVKGKGFNTYPDYNTITPNWSATAGRRLANFKPLLEKSLEASVRKAVESLVEMGEDVVKAHAGKDRTPAPMEDAYYEKKDSVVTAEIVNNLKATLTTASWYSNKSEAAFAAACLIRGGKLDLGIELANAVAKSMGGTMGGGMHGSYEALAYMHMVDELKMAGVVSGSGSSKVRLDGETVSVKNAIGMSDACVIEAVDCAVALKVNRIQKVDMTAHRGEIGMEIGLKTLDVEKGEQDTGSDSEHGDGSRWDEISVQVTPAAGSLVRLHVKLTDGYKEGDVLCVVLPDSISRVIAGAKVKKFQMDFLGKDSIDVDLVCHAATEKPQSWAAVVRNMYDPARIGCTGLLTTQVI